MQLRHPILAPLCTGLVLLLSPAAAAQDDDLDDILVPADDTTAAPAVAPSKTVGLVPLVPVGEASKALAAQVTEGLTREFGDAGFAVQALPIEASSGPARDVDMGQGQRELKAAEKKVKKARRYLDRLNFGRAERDFKAALKAYGGASAALTDVTPVVEVQVGLAEVYARQGMEPEAREALSAAVRLNPEYQLDPAKYPPLFIRTHNDVRKGVVEEARGTIFVDESAAGAEVQIDGRVVGLAPIRVTQVLPGTHVVRVFREQVGLFGAQVEVAEGGEEVVSPGFVEDGGDSPLDILSGNRMTEDAARAVADKAREAGVDAAVIGVVGRTDLEVPTALIVVDASSGQLAHLPRLAFDGDLLNMAIEALRAKERIAEVVENGAWTALDDEGLVPGTPAGGEVEVAEVALRFEIPQPTIDENPRAIGAAPTGDRDRALDDEPGDNSRVVSSGRTGRRRSLRDQSGDRDRFGGGRSRPSDENVFESESGEFYAQPWFWGVVAGGATVAIAALAGGGGAAYYFFLAPPTAAQVNANLP